MNPYTVYTNFKYELKLKEIGRRFGISESGVTQASRRVRSKMDKDKKLARRIKKIAKIVNV